MTKIEFLEFYDNVIKVLGNRFVAEYDEFQFSDNASAVYEEYLNQKTILRMLYGKNLRKEALLDRHKVCACITAAIIKVRLLTGKVNTDIDYELSNSSRINEQLAFMSAWELFLGFIRVRNEENPTYILPQTYHNDSFLDTITRSLFMANQLNSLSTPLIANVFFLLEKYCECENKKLIAESKLSEPKEQEN